MTTQIEILKQALKDAATSLETISRLAGEKYYLGDDGKMVLTYMYEHMDVRMYADARAKVARDGVQEALALAPQPEQEPPFSVQQAYAMAQVCLDLHEALGCKWGDNPYLAIAGLREAQPQQEPVATLLRQSKQNYERNFGTSAAADWIYSDLLELLDTTPPHHSASR